LGARRNTALKMFLIMGWTTGDRFLIGAKDFSVCHHIQTSSGVHPASYPVGTGGSFSGGVVAGT